MRPEALMPLRKVRFDTIDSGRLHKSNQHGAGEYRRVAASHRRRKPLFVYKRTRGSARPDAQFREIRHCPAPFWPFGHSGQESLRQRVFAGGLDFFPGRDDFAASQTRGQPNGKQY
jgi:hypothetical protein